ncbi:MAG: polyphosphate polymerase domain-containing protein [Candidatus Bathyarchaeota archaeon]|nr:polyphosphate polymerase domain-containing protein [Candidatus Bathyarchaeota archaeon]
MAGEKEIHFRHELKHSINLLQYQVLQKKLATLLTPDPNMGTKKSYNIRNLYFDDFMETALCDKSAGVFKRKKYRMRIYNHSDAVIKFERKSKVHQYILKESTRLTRKEADQIISGQFEFIANTKDQLLKDFYVETRNNLMRPVTIVEYDREAYIHPVGNVRITFDTNLRVDIGTASFFDGNLSTMSVIDQPAVLMEIKYNEFIPQYICGLFPDTINPQVAFGKFSMCRTQKKCQAGPSACRIPSSYH